MREHSISGSQRQPLTLEVPVLFWGVLGLALLIGLVLFILPTETAVYGPWVFLNPRWAFLISAAYIGSVLLLLFAAGIAQAITEGLPVDQLFPGLLPLNSPGHFLHLVTGGIGLYLGLAPPRLQAESL